MTDLFDNDFSKIVPVIDKLVEISHSFSFVNDNLIYTPLELLRDDLKQKIPPKGRAETANILTQTLDRRAEKTADHQKHQLSELDGPDDLIDGFDHTKTSSSFGGGGEEVRRL